MSSVVGQSIGRPIDRIDGPAKVTGAARYTADVPVPRLAFAALVMSTIPHGRVRAIDTRAAEAAPGVIKVLTHLNMPRLEPMPPEMPMQQLMPMQSERIEHEGQPVAMVVAETLDEATHAAKLVSVQYAGAAEPARVDFRQDLASGHPVRTWMEPDTEVGDVEAGLARADARIERVYRTADRHHVPMEPSATIARWDDGKLEVFDATQWVWGVRMTLAAAFGMRQEDIRVRNHFCGGGFGCKGFTWPHEILAAVAARETGRPVKLVLTRAQTFTAHGYQPATEQTIALGAASDGRLTAIRHASVTPTAAFQDYMEYACSGTRMLYACPAIATTHRAVAVHRGVPTPMRAPHEGPGMVALEIAMDELAAELAIDPVQLRMRNHAERDPTTGKPFSSKKLIECYREAAERFGWSRRDAHPRSMREGRDLVGWGMASAIMTTFRFPASARVTIDRDDQVLVEAGCQEIGTGAHTIMPQIAADALGVPVDRVRLSLGDTTLPETGGTFGSSTTLGVGSAVHDAAVKLKAKLDGLAKRKGTGKTRAAGYGRILEQAGKEELSAEGRWSPGADASELGEARDWSMASFGAVFAEVRVDEALTIPRVSRVVGVYSAGRIVNPKTAKSNVVGGIVWGIGQALLEASETDPVLGRYLSKNLAGYLVPVNADVGAIDVSFVDEIDPHASAIGARGIGELGAVGVGPAIANAVWHATGVRVRELPIRPEMLLEPE